MTTTPPETPTGPPGDPGPAPGTPYDAGPRVTRDEVRDLGRLRRSTSDRKVAGVAGGLARHLDIDPVILRVAFVVLVFFGGAGLIVYGALWLLVPEDGRESAPLGLDDRTRSIALIVVGALAALAMVGDSWGGYGFPWPLAILALVVFLFLNRRDSGRPSAPGPGQVPPAPTYGPTAYGPTTYGPAAYAAPPAQQYAQSYARPTYAPPVYAPAPVRPRNPRKRGPILFWFTLAVIALAEGVLGIADLAGASVADSAYPALAVGISGLMLLVGAFYGRAGGLILVALVSTIALAGATAAGEWDGTEVRATPPNAASVASVYDMSNGEIVLDLREVVDLGALDGRSIRLTGDAGRLEVILPRGLDADVQADVDGPGHISLFGQERGGIDISLDSSHRSGFGSPTILIDADITVGQIEVHQ